MKIKKSVLKAVAIALTIGVANTACTKEKLENFKEKCSIKKNNEPETTYDCPGCGMG
jgi:hypothetical protein